jgi:glycine/D-amino acid oxidase-like deaminating enzyme
MDIDYIIVGQGLCGTLLSRRLTMAGKQVLVFDNGNPAAAGRVAGGIINPVTGKRLVRTWLIEDLLPFAQKEYTEIGQELGTAILKQTNILDFHLTREAADLFESRVPAEPAYLQASGGDWNEFFRYNYGTGVVKESLLVDLNVLLAGWRSVLSGMDKIRLENFQPGELEVTSTAVQYKGITARYIIFCDGAGSAENPWFSQLPWSKDKGEVLIASIPGLPRNFIFRQGISIAPWKDDLFWVGAAHDWKYTESGPSAAFRRKTMDHLDYWLNLPYKIVDHIAALRPANFDRKPFVGFHPVHTRVGIFNGMGGKGCSLAPYFANQFAGHILNGTQIMPDVDINRYARILSR